MTESNVQPFEFRGNPVATDQEILDVCRLACVDE